MRAAGRRCRHLSALALWGLVILFVGSLIGAGGTAGEELHHAGLVVTFAGGQTETRCVEFPEDEISGAELLRRAGLPVVFSGFGGLGEGVCRIGETGCSDPGDCFCQCRGADCAYWSYFALEDGEWRSQSVGASQRRLRDGDVDGWVWGSGRVPPEPVTFGELCPLVAPTEALPSPTAPVGPPGDSPNAGSDTETPPPTAREGEATPPEPSAANDQSASAGPVAGATPPATDTLSPAAARSDDSESVPLPTDAEPAATASDEPGGGPPAGLIAFGAVAGLLAAAVGGLALRRRRGG